MTESRDVRFVMDEMLDHINYVLVAMNPDIVWRIATEDLAPLRQALLALRSHSHR